MIEFSISPACSRGIRTRNGGWGRLAYYVLKNLVNRCRITVKNESCHVDYAFPFTREHSGRCEDGGKG